jgi:CRP/FNR family transcriptional regulator, anaerobic regulatory protein
MSYHQIDAALETIISLNEEIKEDTRKYFKPKSFKRNTILKTEGEAATHMYFLNSGLIRSYIIDGEKEITRQFFFEDSFASDYISFLTKDKSNTLVSTIEDCEVLVVGFNDLEYLYERHPAIMKVGKVMAERAFVHNALRSESMQKDDATTRYKKLIQERPKVIQRVPLYMISSYLGLTPEALSRIRKKME